MRKLQIQALCFGVFLLATLTTSRAGLLIDDWTATSGMLYVADGTGSQTGPSVASGTIAGGRVAYVGAVGLVSSEGPVYSYTDIAYLTLYAHLYRDGITTAGTTVHRITWTPTATYDLLNLSGSSSTEALSFVLNVHAASSSQNFLITVFQASNYATYGATVTGPGDAYFSYTGSLGTPNLTAVTGIKFSTTLPSGAAPSFEFGSLTAVPEPTNVALGVFGGLALAVGGVRVGRRLMVARLTT